MTSRRRVETQLTADEKDLLRGLRSAQRAVREYEDQVERAGITTGRAQQPARGLTSDLGALHSKALLVTGGIGAATAAAYTAGRTLYGLAGAASQVSEAQAKVDVVFGSSAKTVSDFSRRSADDFGISRRAALEAAGAYGNMFRTIGLGEPAAAQMSVRLTELAADMAAFNDADPSEMLQKLRSGLAGEAEPLRTVGVLLSEARVKEEAYAAGIAKRGAELTEAEKVQARYNLILKDTAVQHGQAARESEGLAMQERKLAAAWEDLSGKIGKATEGPFANAIGATAGLLKNVSDLANAATKPIEFTVTVNAKGEQSAGLSPMDIARAGLGFAGNAAAAGVRFVDPLGVNRARRAVGPWVGLAGDLAGLGMDAAGRQLFEAGLAGMRTPVDPFASESEALLGRDVPREKSIAEIQAEIERASGLPIGSLQRDVLRGGPLVETPKSFFDGLSGGGAGGSKSSNVLSAFGLSRVDALMGQLPGTPGSRDIAAFNAAELKFKTLTREIETDLAKLNMTMADLRARGQENTDTYRLLTEESDALSDASARLRYEQTLRLDTVRDSIEAERELEEAQEERAKSMLRIADELTDRLTRGSNLSPQSWLATRGIAAAVAAVGPDGATAGDLDAINVAVSRANELTNARNPEIRATVQVELKSSDLSTPGEP
ncbi:MAG: hypothetical protein AB7G21_04500 [Dehalococcoidia bacterium]